MTHSMIKPHHLERTAYVYLRQSSPGQVRRNHEGKQRQQAMTLQAAALGWPPEQIVLLESDNGRSGSSQHGRIDFISLIEAVLAKAFEFRLPPAKAGGKAGICDKSYPVSRRPSPAVPEQNQHQPPQTKNRHFAQARRCPRLRSLG